MHDSAVGRAKSHQTGPPPATPRETDAERRGSELSAARLLTLPSMSATLSGVIVVAAFGLVAVLGLGLVVALFRVTRAPAADASRGSMDGD